MNRCALIVLYDEKGRVLLQERSADAERLPGYWGFYGGGIKPNESPLEAVKREAFEELNYQLHEPALFFEQPFQLGRRYQRVTEEVENGYMWAFTERFSGSKENLRILEGRSGVWTTVNAVEKLHMMEHDKAVIRTLHELLQSYKSRSL